MLKCHNIKTMLLWDVQSLGIICKVDVEKGRGYFKQTYYVHKYV